MKIAEVFLFLHEIYVMGTHENVLHLAEVLLMSTYNICFCRGIKILCGYPLLSGAMLSLTCILQV